jgi:hypothetical protein
MTGLRPDGRHVWTASTAQTLAPHDFDDPRQLVPPFAWEHGPGDGFPALESRCWTSVNDSSAAAVAKVLGSSAIKATRTSVGTSLAATGSRSTTRKPRCR